VISELADLDALGPIVRVKASQGRRSEKKPQHLASAIDLNWCMGLRYRKGKRLKRTDRPKNDPETRLLSKLQAESLKVHGNPLDTLKKTAARKKGK
jgi:hypothetical protein